MKTCFEVTESQGLKFFFVGSCVFAYEKPGDDYTQFSFADTVKSITAKPGGLEVLLNSTHHFLITGGPISEDLRCNILSY